MPSGNATKPRRAAFPETVGAYELLLPIASGGMGTVYLARKRGPGGFERHVALKLTHAYLREQPEFAAQLIEEAKIASRIVHPNVVSVLDVEDDEYGVFLVMQYVEGDTLGAIMQHASTNGTTVPIDIGLRILTDALTGLHAAHELKDSNGQPLGIVHRDFTPQNILVGTDGVSRLTDFGVAKAVTRAGGTRTGIVKGKTAYMSPEQVRALPLDRRCDVWAAGVIAWEMFAGRRLRDLGADPAALLLRIATEPVERLSAVVPDIPPAVDEVVASALAHDRTRRCPTAEQFRDRLLRAWAPFAIPAEGSDVAEHVQRVAGQDLADRRALARTASTRAMVELPTTDLQSSSDSSAEAVRTEASLSSAAAAQPAGLRGRRVSVLAVEAAIVGAALGVLILGARRLVAPERVVVMSSATALPVPAVPVASQASSATPVATPTLLPTNAAPSGSVDTPRASGTALSVVPAENPHTASTVTPVASSHAPRGVGVGRKSIVRPSHSVDGGVDDLAKNPYE
jgi:eukaryotic-like serine/threonine-protein kinase